MSETDLRGTVSPTIARPYAGRTGRLQDLLRHLCIALGLGLRLLLPVNKVSFLRSIRNAMRPLTRAPQVIGIDDWARRHGYRYGRAICDLERRQIIELLPDREPATVEAWLRWQHQIWVVARDRNGGYCGAVTRALPQAIQVADRWPLLENVSAVFLAAVRRQMPAFLHSVYAAKLDPVLLTAAERLQYDEFQRRQQTNEIVRRMASEGVPINRIVRATGQSQDHVRRIVRGERDYIFRVCQNGQTFWPLRLEREWAAGFRNVAELWRRLRASGYGGSLRVGGKWATRQHRAEMAVLSGSGNCRPVRKIAQCYGAQQQGERSALVARRGGDDQDRVICPRPCQRSVPRGRRLEGALVQRPD